MPDAYNHGERWEKGTVIDFFDALTISCDEIEELILSYAENKAVDVENTGLVGYSMGGCMIYNYLTRKNRRIKTAIPVIGTPDWVSLIRTDEAATLMKRVGMAKTDEDMDNLADKAGRLQPLNNYPDMAGIPVLFMNTELDTIIPVEPVREFFSRLQKISGGDDELRFKNLQGLMHYICSNGFEHHVAMSRSLSADVLEEAFGKYLDWEVYRHR